VALTAILSELLPLFLANVPMRSAGEGDMSAACTWLAVGVICFMIVVLLWSFFLTWPPDMPIDPSTIAGAMYYALSYSASMNRTSTSAAGRRSSSV
jgi:hypothetical protein